MSFSGDVKEELSRQKPGARHCRIAEIAAIIRLCGGVSISQYDRYRIRIQTENLSVARKCFTLLKKTFNIDVDVAIRRNHGRRTNCSYIVTVRKHEDALVVFDAIRELHLRGTCCKRAFLRGAFLSVGSVSDPLKFYHLEFACSMPEHAQQLQALLSDFSLEAKIVQRKRYYVVYLKEGDGIVDVLNVIEAHAALMELENIRILKDMRNTVNRKVNCETANIHKTVNAAVKQLEDIRFIKNSIGFGELSDSLAQMAEVRLANPEASLKELGTLLVPQVGKSGVNHRLRKLSEIAEGLREGKEEKQL